MKAIVSQKGQVTIPKGVRDRLGIRRGKEKIPGGLGVDEYLKKARG